MLKGNNKSSRLHVELLQFSNEVNKTITKKSFPYCVFILALKFWKVAEGNLAPSKASMLEIFAKIVKVFRH